MSELSRLSQALVDRPLVEPPVLGALRARASRRRRRRASALSVVLALAVLSSLGVSRLSGAGSDRGGRVHLAAYFESAIAVPATTLSAVGLPASVSVPAKVSPVHSTTSSEGTVTLRRGRVLPVLRAGALGARRRPLQVRHLQPPERRRFLVVDGRLPAPGELELRRRALLEPLPRL